MGDKAAYLAREAVPFGGFLAGLALDFVKHGGAADEMRFSALVERHILGTELMPRERDYFAVVRERRGVGPWGWLASFYRLPSAWERKIFRTRVLDAHHAARVRLVRELLPAAEEILDVGGADDRSPAGALLAMGYPHRPKRVWIVDLPVAERHYTRPEVSPDAVTTAEGTEVRYVYASMTDLSAFRDGQFGLVWSGQSIEHVTEDEADRLLREAFRVLRPGGWLCLDTPNRKLTRLLGEDRWIHPEHKIEYEPRPLALKIQRAGFVVERMKAITPLPVSARLGRFCKLEAIEEVAVTDDYDAGFSFFVRARKPG